MVGACEGSLDGKRSLAAKKYAAVLAFPQSSLPILAKPAKLDLQPTGLSMQRGGVLADEDASWTDIKVLMSRRKSRELNGLLRTNSLILEIIEPLCFMFILTFLERQHRWSGR